MIWLAAGFRSLPPLPPPGKSPCLDHYGRGVFGGNGPHVGLVPKVGVDAIDVATTVVSSCHIPGRLSRPVFFLDRPDAPGSGQRARKDLRQDSSFFEERVVAI